VHRLVDRGDEQIITGDSSMTGCVIAVLAAALLAYLLAKSWTNRTATDTTDNTARRTASGVVADVFKVGALLVLVVIVFALMAVSVAHTTPHR
jgi:F0F1-type ATP synthase assembly protein I